MILAISTYFFMHWCMIIIVFGGDFYIGLWHSVMCLSLLGLYIGYTGIKLLGLLLSWINMAFQHSFEVANGSCDDDGHPRRTGKDFFLGPSKIMYKLIKS